MLKGINPLSTMFSMTKLFYLSKISYLLCTCFGYGDVQTLLFGKKLNLSQTSPGFYVSAVQVL